MGGRGWGSYLGCGKKGLRYFCFLETLFLVCGERKEVGACLTATMLVLLARYHSLSLSGLRRCGCYVARDYRGEGTRAGAVFLTVAKEEERKTRKTKDKQCKRTV